MGVIDKQFLIDLLNDENTEIVASESEVKGDEENKNWLYYSICLRTAEVGIDFKSDSQD